MLKRRSKPWITYRVTIALTFVGQPAIPILQAALADPNQLNRPDIVAALEMMAMADYGSLSNEDQYVREIANTLLQSPQSCSTTAAK